MKVYIKKTIRCLTEGSVFSFKKGELNIILGKNGSGKTTLLNAIRGYFEPASNNNWDLETSDRKDLSKSISIEGVEGIQWIGLSKEDDPASSLDAFTYIERGGLSLSEMSQGQKAFKMALKVASDAILLSKQNHKIGLILDEVDSHLDCYHQLKLSLALANLSIKYGVTILMTTHHFGVIMGCNNCLELEGSKFTPISGNDYYIKLTDKVYNQK